MRSVQNGGLNLKENPKMQSISQGLTKGITNKRTPEEIGRNRAFTYMYDCSEVHPAIVETPYLSLEL